MGEPGKITRLLVEALEMVRDADDDCKRDGLPTIPPAARAKIDTALASVPPQAVDALSLTQKGTDT